MKKTKLLPATARSLTIFPKWTKSNFLCDPPLALIMDLVECFEWGLVETSWSILSTIGLKDIDDCCLVHSDLEFVKSFTPVRFPKFSILRAKSINRTFLGNKWEWGMFYSFILNKLTVFVPLSTQIQTHSSLEESSLTNFTDRLIFRINSWKIYPSPEILCANVTCDFCENSLFLQFIQHTKYFHTDRGGGEIKRNSACDEEKLDNLAKRDQQKSSLALGHYGLSGCFWMGSCRNLVIDRSYIIRCCR